MKEVAEGAVLALLVGIVVAAFVLGGPVAGAVTAVLACLLVIIVLLVRIADRSAR
jgi:hypothetical protein